MSRVGFSFRSIQETGGIVIEIKANGRGLNMGRNYRVIKRHVCQTPIESLQLEADLMRVDLMKKLVRDMDAGSICTDRHDGREELRLLAQKLKLWERVAWERLRGFLAVDGN